MKNSSCLRVAVAGLTMMGVWYPPATEKSYIARYLFYLYAVSYQLLVYYPVIAIEVLHVFSVLGDVDEMLSVSLLMLTHFTMAPKIYIIWHRQEKIKSFLRLLDSDKFTRTDPIKKAIIEKTTNFAYTMSVIFAVLVSLTGCLWALFPVLKPTLELPLGYPKMDSKSWLFIPVYVYQISSMTLVGLSAAAADMLIGGAMALATAELDLLCYELAHIDHNANAQVQSRAELEIHHMQHDEDLYSEAVSCVKFHEDIMRLVQEMEESFSLPILFQFIASSVIICAIVLKITISSEPMEIITMVFYFMCVNTELVVLCYFGDIMKSKSEEVSQAAYFSDWMSMSLRSRKAVLMIVMRAQRPLVLTAGSIFNVRLTTFTTVLRTSYSYFAVLKQRS